jgi:hypothetical protein
LAAVAGKKHSNTLAATDIQQFYTAAYIDKKPQLNFNRWAAVLFPDIAKVKEVKDYFSDSVKDKQYSAIS